MLGHVFFWGIFPEIPIDICSIPRHPEDEKPLTIDRGDELTFQQYGNITDPEKIW